MTFMIKNFTLLIFLSLSSCSYISYNQAIPLLKNAIVGAEDINVDEEYINSRKYSFMKIKIGRSAVSVLSLASIDADGLYKWVNSSGESIYTFNGKIVKTTSIVHDLQLYNYDDFKLSLVNPVIQTSYDTFVYNPLGFVTQEASIKPDESLKQNGIIIFTEKIISKGFSWKFTNEYYLDTKLNRVVKSKQFIHPKYPEIEIDFYYK